MFVTMAFAQETAPATDGSKAPETESATHPAVAGAHTEAGHGPGGKSVFPPFDSSKYPSQLLWLAVTFGLFYLFLKKVVLPRIGGILEVRRDRIAQDLEQAARMKNEADAAVAAYEQELAEAKANAGAIAQKARDKARADADVERKKVEAELEQRLTNAEANISSIKTKALSEVDGIAEDAAATMISELVGGKVDKAAIAAAIKAARS